MRSKKGVSKKALKKTLKKSGKELVKRLFADEHPLFKSLKAQTGRRE